MQKRDYYEILQISKDCSESEIKRAYRGLAMKYHPDRNQNDQQAVAKMKEINEAYAVLSDSHKRQLYDTYGHAGLEGYSASDIFGGIDFDSLFREFGLGSFGFGGSIFDSFFGSGRTATRQHQRGADLQYDLEVTLEEVYAGVEKQIEIPHSKNCKSCQGSGAKKGGLKTCERCQGSGQIIKQQKSGFGIFRQISTCGACHGSGSVVKEKCEACQGKGVLHELSQVSVTIPRGADSGYHVKIEGEGESGSSGADPGDLYVVVNVKKHEIFERHGDDIYLKQDISLVDAALGGELDNLPSLNGYLKLEIPEGTQSGDVLRLMNKGIPHLKGPGQGDLYVLAKVVTPTNLSDRQKELLKEFAIYGQEKNNQ